MNIVDPNTDSIIELASNLDGVSAESLDILLNTLKNPEKINSFVEEFLAFGRPGLPSLFFRSQKSRVLFSLYASHRNFLVFKDRQLIYVIVQHHQFCQALYFPKEKTLLGRGLEAVGDSIVSGFEAEITRLGGWERLSTKCEEVKGKAVFIGYDRPYHYFYDTLPQVLDWQLTIPPEVRFTTISGYDFLSSADFFERNESIRFQDYTLLNDFLVSESYIQLILGYSRRDLRAVARHDDLIARKAFNKVKKARLERIDEIKARFDVVLWVGICSEKRSWVNIDRALTGLMSWLENNNKTFHVVFDGITSVESAELDKVAENDSYIHEQALLHTLSEGLSASQMTSLIGAYSWEKIAYSSVADFFITSFLTDSMYPARFGATSGIGHGANAAMSSDHLHSRTFFIPKQYVEDEPLSGNWSTVSYSIDTEFFVRYAASIIDERHRNINVKHLGFRNSCSSNVELKNSNDSFFSFEYGFSTPVYARINDKYLGFEQRSVSSTYLDPGVVYFLNFSCLASSRKGCTLHVIVCKGGERLTAHTVSPNESICLFPEEYGTYVNFYFRFQGEGYVEEARVAFGEVIASKIPTGISAGSGLVDFKGVGNCSSLKASSHQLPQLNEADSSIIDSVEVSKFGRRLAISVKLSGSFEFSNPAYAYYLYKDGERLSKVMYDAGPDYSFNGLDNGVYRVVAFVRTVAGSDSAKSKKVTLD